MRTSGPVSRVDLAYKAPAGRALYLALLLCALFSALAAPDPAGAAPDNFVHGRTALVRSGGMLTLSLPLSVDNEDALSALLRDGASIELLVKVEIQRQRTLWFNENIFAASFSWVLRYDPLARDFRMTQPLGGQNMQDKNLRTLLGRTWKALRLPLVELASLQGGEAYTVKADFSLRHTALPPWLDRTLVFWNKDVVNPDSIELEYKVDDAPISR